MKCLHISLAVVAGAACAVGAMEIPLGVSAAAAPVGGGKTAVVDMARVLDTFPETQRREKELRKQIADVDSELAARQDEIDTLSAAIESAAMIQRELQQPTTGPIEGFVLFTDTDMVGSDSVPAAGPADGQPPVDEAAVARQSEELEKKVAALKVFRDEQQSVIAANDRALSQAVMGKIYQVLEELAREEGIAVIIDVHSVLYGQPGIDLTERLIDRIAGTR